MKNIGEWIHNYNNLSFEQKYEVAKTIVNSIGNNQYYFMQNDEEMKKVIDFFNQLLESFNQKQSIDGQETIIEKFKGLSQVNKGKVLKEIITLIEFAKKNQDYEDRENICKREGHVFSKWKHYHWTRYIDTIIDHECVCNYPVEMHSWGRICSRCGYQESVEREPDEVWEARMKKEKNERIKVLEKELRNLKGINK